ncbi:uncharacterized protein Dwil_GK28327 [Drosophila willistoni]|uniref:Uncharacterized protein n=1 Tax=Drosophila willistoni TaxID=7260 RepID=A0A0Q9WZ83_DROWI|nr:uncharacterized protein Dwil_GK28327 [Drosophila willistoni]
MHTPTTVIAILFGCIVVSSVGFPQERFRYPDPAYAPQIGDNTPQNILGANNFQWNHAAKCAEIASSIVRDDCGP